MSFSLNGQSSSSKTTIDPQTRAAMFDNWNAAQGLRGQAYRPVGPDQIKEMMNPYLDEVAGLAGQDFERQRLMAVNATGDAASRAKAFGGSRHGVAEALTNEAALRQAAMSQADLRRQGYEIAQGAALQQNAAMNQYPLQIQSLLNETLGAITPNTKTKGRQMGFTANATPFPKLA